MTIEEAKRRLFSWAQSKAEVRKLWIFGSRHKVTAKPTSDIDIAVEVNHEPEWETDLTAIWFEKDECWKSELADLFPWKVDLFPWKVDLQFYDPNGTTPCIEKYLRDDSALIYYK